jgi:hypothetical protein
MVIDKSNFQSRRMMPAFLTIVFFWAVGFGWILDKLKRNWQKIMLVVMILCVIGGMCFGEYEQNQVSRHLWASYKADFDVVKAHIPINETILGPASQCIAFKLERTVINPTTKIDHYTKLINITRDYLTEQGINYVYITQHHKLIPDFYLLNDTFWTEITYGKLMYTNQNDTWIYKWNAK